MSNVVGKPVPRFNYRFYACQKGNKTHLPHASFPEEILISYSALFYQTWNRSTWAATNLLH